MREVPIRTTGIAAAAPDHGNTVVLQAHGPGTLIVPHGNLLLTAHYIHEGADLRLVGADGSQVLIRDYFNGPSPSLQTEGGARIEPDLAAKLAGPLAPGQYAQAGGAAAPQPIGYVESLTGNATATHSDGSKIALGNRVAVFQGDVIQTGPGANVGIVFVDKTTFALEGDARMVLDEMVYDPGTKSGNAAFSLVQGVFVYVSGEVAHAHPESVSIRTPVATIGVRGTEGGFNVHGAVQGGETSVTIFSGAFEVTTDAGSVLLNTPGATTAVLNISQPPAPPVIQPLAQVQQLYGNAQSVVSQSVNAYQQHQQEQHQQQQQQHDQQQQQQQQHDQQQQQEQPGQPGEQPHAGPGPGGAPGNGPGPADAGPPGPIPSDGLIPSTFLGLGAPPPLPPPSFAPPPLFTLAPPDPTFTVFLAPPPPPPPPPPPSTTTTTSSTGPIVTTSGSIDGTSGADLLTGTAGNDVINGFAGNDTLLGLDGSDFLHPGAGNDSVDGGLGLDLVSYFDSPGPVTASLAGQIGFDGFGTIDTLIGAEAIEGSGFNDSLTGDTTDNILRGLGGDDTLDGGGGNNILEGDAGNDSLIGSAGSHDTATFVDATGPVNADLGTGLAFGDGNDTLSGIENLDGSAFNDTLQGDSLDNALFGQDGNDSLNGGIGNDILEGGRGDDTIDGGGGNDTASYEHASGQVAVDLTAGTASGADGNDILLAIQNVIGSSFDDVITLDSQNNFADGGSGNDSISGQAGNDTIAGGPGNDTIDGGIGTDAVDYIKAPGPVSVNLGAGTATGDGSDVLIGIEVVGGSNFNDSLVGGSANETLIGNAGVDTLTGGAGADHFGYELPTDGGNVPNNQTAAAAGAVGDTITDFVSTLDSLDFKQGPFSATFTFVVIGSAYDGTNSTVGSGAAFVLDSTGNLNYDADVNTAGYTVVANVGTSTPVAVGDIHVNP